MSPFLPKITSALKAKTRLDFSPQCPASAIQVHSRTFVQLFWTKLFGVYNYFCLFAFEAQDRIEFIVSLLCMGTCN